jgi:hypothetical protein
MKKNIDVHHVALDPYFVMLDEVLKKFNIFDATGMNKQEIKHTRFLGYLLDPNESHGLGSKFLLEFLQNSNQQNPSQTEKFIKVLDLNLAMARVETECHLGMVNDKKRIIDILIEVPNSVDGSRIVIGIENKLLAGQGEAQLSDYRVGIEEKFPGVDSFLYYLTLQGEESEGNDWVDVTYANVVVPILEKILRNGRDVVSDYLLFILNDYLDLIREEDEGNSEAEELVEKINVESRRLIKKSEKSENLGLLKLKTLYPRAYEYLVEYDGDPRLVVRDSFVRMFNGNGVLGFGNNQIYLEKAGRSDLHFSCLSEDNQMFFQKNISSNPVKRWMPSKRNLAFELNLTPSGEGCIDGKVNLVFGTTNSGFEGRQKLIEKITNALNPNGGVTIPTGPTTSTIPLAEGWPSIRGKSKDEITVWLTTTLELLANKYSETINMAIENFRSSKPFADA